MKKKKSSKKLCKVGCHNYLPTKMGSWDDGYWLALTCTKCGDYKEKR